MAMEKLYELVNSDEFDIVVVDTPPTRNALDLLDAPRRLTRFLENKLFRALLVPTRMSLRAVSMATAALLRTVSKVAGAEIVQDAVDFFRAFEGMEEGFDTRAQAVRRLLADPATAYLLITSPRPDSIAEAGYFAERLAQGAVVPAALVVNRVHPEFDALGAAVPRPADGPLEALLENHARLREVAAEERRAVASLAERVAPSPVARLALLDTDVHDLDGLARVADRLYGPVAVG
jgi:anion-transporting  ArsA/GET3 family ATPase